MGHEQRSKERLLRQMADEFKQNVPGYINCGKDAEGHQLVVLIGAIIEMSVSPLVEESNGAELVTLTYVSGSQRTLGEFHSRVFLEKTGLRNPETQRVIIPDTAGKFNLGN